ncbi:VOC family protein [Pontibacter saemangeumensis]
MEPRLTLITLGVTNLQRSKAFYEHIFGWQPTSMSNESIVFFQLNGIQLALFPQESLADDAGVPADGKGFRRFSLAYNVQSEQEVDELVAALAAKGVKVLKQPEKVFWGGYSSYIADPDENLWEIAYNPFIPLQGKDDFENPSKR